MWPLTESAAIEGSDGQDYSKESDGQDYGKESDGQDYGKGSDGQDYGELWTMTELAAINYDGKLD